MSRIAPDIPELQDVPDAVQPLVFMRGGVVLLHVDPAVAHATTAAGRDRE